jgi:hypothetical protein
MARKSKHHAPGWLPFALAASAVTALVAGARAGWKLSGEAKAPAPASPSSTQKAGVLQDWASGVVYRA